MGCVIFYKCTLYIGDGFFPPHRELTYREFLPHMVAFSPFPSESEVDDLIDGKECMESKHSHIGNENSAHDEWLKAVLCKRT